MEIGKTKRAPLRAYSNLRIRYSFRIDGEAMERVQKAIKRVYFGNTAALVETMVVQYATAYDYATQSMPIWKTALVNAPEEIKKAAEQYPPFLHYQFSSAKSHTAQEQGYFIQIRHFSTKDTAVVELRTTEPKTMVVPLSDLSPLYCCRDIVNELNR